MTTKAFTIVEVLVVVLVVAILAAVTIVAYNGVTRSAVEASLQADLRKTSDNLTVEYIAQKVFPDTLGSLESKSGSDTQLVYTKSSGTSFCLTAMSSKTPKKFYVSEDQSIKEGECPFSWTSFGSSSFGNNACGIGSNGVAYCWGYNNYGKLGDGTTTQRTVPTPIQQGEMPSGVRLTQVTAGNSHTCGIGSDQKAYCWGMNTYGQLGNGATTDSSTPVAVSQGQIPNGVTLTKLAVGNWHTCALGSNGWMYCWGSNSFSQIGDGTTGSANNRFTPVAVLQGAMPAGSTARDIDTGGGSHNCVIASNNQAYCWGYNGSASGGLGDGTTVSRTSPVAVLQGAIPSGVTTVKLEVGFESSCIIGSDGKVYCWGNNSYGQLGDGTTVMKTSPVALAYGSIVSPGTQFQQILLGWMHACALDVNQRAYCWGSNSYSQLGDGTTIQRLSPVAVLPGNIPNDVQITALSSGGNTMYARGSNGKLYGWGYNAMGSIGDGTVIQRSTPVQVVDP